MPLPLIAGLASALGPAGTAAAISGGTTLLGGLLGRRKQKPFAQQLDEKRQHEEQRYTWLRDGAKNAGFNPLTVLGAAGHTAGNMPVDTETPLGWKAALGDAIRAGGQAFSEYDPIREESLQLDNELKKRQITSFDNERSRQGSAGSGLAQKVQPLSVETDPDTGFQVKDNVVDLGSDDLRKWRLGPKSLWPNQYVVRGIKDPTAAYVFPNTWSPAEPTEGLLGDIPSEIRSIGDLLNLGADELKGLGVERVQYKRDTGEVLPMYDPMAPENAIRSPNGEIIKRGPQPLSVQRTGPFY